jgi:hypothetical protein
MTKLNSLARDRVIGPEVRVEDGAARAGIGEGAAGVDVLVVSSSVLLSRGLNQSKIPCVLAILAEF